MQTTVSPDLLYDAFGDPPPQWLVMETAAFRAWARGVALYICRSAVHDGPVTTMPCPLCLDHVSTAFGSPPPVASDSQA